MRPPARAETPEPEVPAAPSRGGRAADWNGAATLLTGIAAVAGLFFTGISTYYGYQTARDQLHQSVQDDYELDSRQAERVSVWVKREKNGGAGLVLTNRSRSPVSDVYLKVSAVPGASQKNAAQVYVAPVLHIRALPPCSAVSLPAEVVREDIGRAWTSDTALDVETLWFRDAEGRPWRREHTGALAHGWGTPEERDEPTLSNRLHPPLRQQVTDAHRPVEGCGPDD
ncbi:hypothetical protein ACFV20_13320 [Streptomyces sp. NPDC059696]|uniref:hypothetical protein n=1 Tax=Streptomyces sp. NPDC059696 TaxID=3346911 RepID=UPI00367743A4